MSLTSFSFPTPTLFGAGALNELPDRLKRLGIQRPLVVTDPGLLTTRAFQTLSQTLGSDALNRAWFVFSQVHPNPTEPDLRAAALAAQASQCDGIIGFGGGSALDVAKATPLLVKRPALDLTRFYDETDWSGLLPFVAIPTTAGTGSEVGRSSVITLDQTHRKAVLFNPALLARLVILDAILTTELPPKLTAATGADALTHCIESYTCPVFHPLCDGIALEGIHLVVQALPRAVQNGQDLEARGHMLVAAAMGAIAFQKDLGVVHSLAHPLSTLAGLHHGLANALCLPASMRFCADRKPGLYRRVGLACNLDLFHHSDAQADTQTIDFIADFLVSLGIQGRLRDHGVDPQLLEALVEQATADPCHKTNAVPVSTDDLRQLYQAVL